MLTSSSCCIWYTSHSGFSSLAPGKFEWNFRHVIFRDFSDWCWGISCGIALIWMSLDFTDDQSTLVQVIAWCHQATSHYLSQSWPRSLLPYYITSDAKRSVYTERVQYLAWKICVLYCYSQNLYFTGAQNLYFAGVLYFEVQSYIALIIRNLSRNGVYLCNKVFLLVLSVMINIGFIVTKYLFCKTYFMGWAPYSSTQICILWNRKILFRIFKPKSVS